MKHDFTNNNFQRAAIAPIIGMALSSIGTIAANISGDKTRKELNRLKDIDPQYTESPYAKQQFGLAQTLLNARMPGAADVEKNIYGNQANTQATVERNATDSSQALALAAAGQGATNQAFQQEGIVEGQNQMAKVENYNQGAKAMTDEHQTVYNDNVRRWQDQVNIALARHGIRQQQGQNMSNLGASISSMGGSFPSGGGKAKSSGNSVSQMPSNFFDGD